MNSAHGTDGEKREKEEEVKGRRRRKSFVRAWQAYTEKTEASILQAMWSSAQIY